MIKARATQERIDFVVAQLVEQKRAHGTLTNYMIDRAADSLGVSRRTMRRWVTAGSTARKKRDEWTPQEEDKLLYFECRGNISEVYRRRQQQGLATPSRRQLARAFDAAFTPAERAFAKEGEEGYRRHSIYLRVEHAHRNELW